MGKKRDPQSANHRRAMLEELEPRVLLSADVQSVLSDPDPDRNLGESEPAAQLALLDANAATSDSVQQTRREVVIIDASVEDARELLQGLNDANAPPGTAPATRIASS